MNCRSWGEGRPSSEATPGATTDAPPEARWSVERISVDEGLICGQVLCCITLYCARLGRGGRRTLSVVEVDSKRKVGTNSGEVKLLEDKG